MKQQINEKFTKYEIARIIGARALQIAMDAPLLLKLSKEELEKIKYGTLKIAELELEEDVLPIAIHKQIPRKGRDKLSVVKEDKKEIVENPEEFSLVEEDEEVISPEPSASEEAQ